MTAVDVTVVIVNWNGAELLDDCLQSIVDFWPAWLSHEVVVVDNASTDGSVALLEQHWPEVQVIVNEENVGFCRANNQAIRAGDAPLLLLLNTDARLTRGCVASMVDRMESDPGAAVIGPRLVYGDGSFQRWTAGRSLSLGTCASYLLGADRLAARFPRLSGMYLSHDTHQPFQAGWVSSAAMLLRRRAVEEVGLLDESIFVYMDDVDLCERVRAAGWHVWYAADATCVHLMGATTKRRTGQASPEALRALNRWYQRRHGPGSTHVLRAIETAGFAARAGVCGVMGIARRNEGDRLRARAHWRLAKLSREPVTPASAAGP